MKVWRCLKTSFKSRGSLVVECLPPVPPVPILAVHKNASVLILLILGFVFFQTQSSFYRDKMRWLLVTLILFEPLIAAPRTEQQQGRIKRQTQVIKKIRGDFPVPYSWFFDSGSREVFELRVRGILLCSNLPVQQWWGHQDRCSGTFWPKVQKLKCGKREKFLWGAPLFFRSTSEDEVCGEFYDEFPEDCCPPGQFASFLVACRLCKISWIVDWFLDGFVVLSCLFEF